MTIRNTLAEERFLARIQVTVELSRIHGFEFVAAFMVEHGPAIDRAFDVLHAPPNDLAPRIR